MLGFNLNVKTLSELEAKIEYGFLDKDIREYLFTELRDEKITCEPSELFEICAEIEESDKVLYLYNDDRPRSLNNKEKEILKKFVDKINSIYSSITEDELKKRFGSLINAKRLFMDIEQLGMPEINYYSENVWVNGKVDKIDIDNTQVVLSAGQMYIAISYLNDYLRVTMGGRPSNLLVACKKCYDVVNPSGNHTGFYIYWKE